MAAARPCSDRFHLWGCGLRGLIRRSVFALLLGGAMGCGTTRVTNTQRAATEQLLVSNAIDQAVSQLDFRVLAGKPVFFDGRYLAPGPDQGYLVSTLRQQVLASGCLLQETRASATYVVEARSGGVGTDQSALLIGVPQMNVPSVLPGQPSLIPEIPLAKRTDQKGVAKIAVFAYNRYTGRPVFQSGVVQAKGTSKDTWVLGAGPFRRGTLGEATDIAGAGVAIPYLSGKEGGGPEVVPVLAVTSPAVWVEPPDAPLSSVPRAFAAPEPAKMSPALVPLLESVTGVPLGPKAPAAAANAASGLAPPPAMEPIQYPTWLFNPGTGGPPSGKDPGARKTNGPALK